MSTYINAMKEQIKSLSTSLKESYPLLPMRLAFIGYRDHCDKDRLAVQCFTQYVEEFKTFVGSQHATGGGDGPEDIFGALNRATDLDWQSATRFLYLIADAPCHGRQYHDIADDYPDGDKYGLMAENLLPALAAKNIVCFFGKINSSTDIMMRKFNEIMRSDGASGQFMETLNMAITSAIVDTVSLSVATTRSASLSYSASTDIASRIDLSKIPTSSLLPDWKRIKNESIILYDTKVPTSLDQLLSGSDASLVDSKHPRIVSQKVAEIPFGKGASRLAYWANPAGGSASQTLVHKVMVRAKASELTRTLYEGILANQSLGIYFSRAFTSERPAAFPAITYIPVHLLQYHQRSPDYPYATQETALIGLWEKFNNNHGWINDNPVKATGTDHTVVQAFSHWTYHHSRGKMLLVDCQGVFDASTHCFRLTDPAIHCTDVTRLSATNLGKNGMNKFFATHRCNDCCLAMGLTPPVSIA